LENFLAGVFGSDASEKHYFEESIGKKSESEGLIVYHRSEGDRRFSILDDAQFPTRIQGYTRIASIIDYAFLIYPSSREMTSADGELAVLIDSFHLNGSIEVFNSVEKDGIRTKLKGLHLADFPVEEREFKSSILDTSRIGVSTSFPSSGTLIYIDRAFNVKGVGLVVLGFILSGKVRVHDKLRLIPTEPAKQAEVKGIQLNDEDQETAGRGVRVGLSLKGVELKDLEKVSWLDDSSFELTDKIVFTYEPGKFYKQTIVDKDLHLQLPGELSLARVTKLENSSDRLQAKTVSKVPVWQGMRLVVVDLNGKPLRIAGGGIVVPL
jgi:selenocysteine-specific translation elongation factor